MQHQLKTIKIMALTTYYIKLQKRALNKLKQLEKQIEDLPSIDDENLTESLIDRLDEQLEILENLNLN